MNLQQFHGMKSTIFHEVIEKCFLMVETQKPILIIGEFGTGKGWVAQTIHEISFRQDEMFYKINCYSLQPEEIDRKLFGFLSFTENQSVELNRGLFEIYNHGTFFFEGFETLPTVLQKKIFDTVRHNSTNNAGNKNSDIRIIMSVNGNTYLNREYFNYNLDTIYKMNPHLIYMPPLRKRREDIAPLIYNFLELMHLNENKYVTQISPGALYLCIHYNWPGNIKQLKNAVKLAHLLSNGQPVKAEHFPESVKYGQPTGEKLLEIQQSKTFQTAEKYLIQELIKSENSPQEIAYSLGIESRAVIKKIRRYLPDKVQTN